MSKAKRNAQTAARRGIAQNDKPTKMDVEKEVYRQQRAGSGGGAGAGGRRGILRPGGNNSNNNNGGGGGRPRRSVRVNAVSRTEAERKTKAKNLAEKRKNQQVNTNNKDTSIKAPPKKVVNAAVKAMKSSGFSPPKGMKMVISFKPIENKNNNNNVSNTNNNNSNRNNRNRNNDNRNNQMGGRGRQRN